MRNDKTRPYTLEGRAGQSSLRFATGLGLAARGTLASAIPPPIGGARRRATPLPVEWLAGLLPPLVRSIRRTTPSAPASTLGSAMTRIGRASALGSFAPRTRAAGSPVTLLAVAGLGARERSPGARIPRGSVEARSVAWLFAAWTTFVVAGSGAWVVPSAPWSLRAAAGALTAARSPLIASRAGAGVSLPAVWPLLISAGAEALVSLTATWPLLISAGAGLLVALAAPWSLRAAAGAGALIALAPARPLRAAAGALTAALIAWRMGAWVSLTAARPLGSIAGAGSLVSLTAA